MFNNHDNIGKSIEWICIITFIENTLPRGQQGREATEKDGQFNVLDSAMNVEGGKLPGNIEEAEALAYELSMLATSQTIQLDTWDNLS